MEDEAPLGVPIVQLGANISLKHTSEDLKPSNANPSATNAVEHKTPVAASDSSLTRESAQKVEYMAGAKVELGKSFGFGRRPSVNGVFTMQDQKPPVEITTARNSRVPHPAKPIHIPRSSSPAVSRLRGHEPLHSANPQVRMVQVNQKPPSYHQHEQQANFQPSTDSSMAYHTFQNGPQNHVYMFHEQMGIRQPIYYGNPYGVDTDTARGWSMEHGGVDMDDAMEGEEMEDRYYGQYTQDSDEAEAGYSFHAYGGRRSSPLEDSGDMLSGYEAYLRDHQQEKHDADERWQNATPEEWKAGRLGNNFCATGSSHSRLCRDDGEDERNN
jgi:hypothetical protein